MITEQIIEERVIESLSELDGFDQLQILGAWQKPEPFRTDVVGYVSVKVSPRQFETFTIADGSMSVRISLNVRTEVDKDQLAYLGYAEKITDLITDWHRSFAASNERFAVDGQFYFSGLRLDGGDCGADRENGFFSFDQSFTVQGIFDK